MLKIVLFTWMIFKVTSDAVCDGDSEGCGAESESVLLSQKSQYIPGVIGNYEPSADSEDTHDQGPGAGGEAVIIPRAGADLKRFGMSEAVSDLISLSRTIPDTRVRMRIQKTKKTFAISLFFYLASRVYPLALSHPPPQCQCCPGVP